jgi:hypothetical protein
MPIPGQILVRDDSSYWSADGESVITLEAFEYDDINLSYDVEASRWEPNEKVVQTGNTSPRFPQRRRSVVNDAPLAVDLPKMPRRRLTILPTTSTHSPMSKLSFTPLPKEQEQRQERELSFPPESLSAYAPRMALAEALRPLPSIARGLSPPKFPCRKKSTESWASPAPTRYEDLCEQHPTRKCKCSSSPEHKAKFKREKPKKQFAEAA